MELRPFTIRDAVNGVKSRKLLVITIFTLVLVLVGVATLLTEKMYQSEAKIFVRLGKENVGLDPTLALGEKPIITAPMSREAEINSVMFMIQSRNLYEKVADEIGHERILEGEPDEEGKGPGLIGSILGPLKESLKQMGVVNDISRRELAIIKIGEQLSVKTMDRSNVIVVNYEGESPKLSQDVVSSIVQHYREWHVKMHMLSGTQEVLLVKAKEIETELEKREQELEEFKATTGVISSNLDSEQFVNRIGTIKDALLTADSEASALEKEVKEIENNLGSVSRRREQVIQASQGNNPVYDEILTMLLTKQPALEAARSRSKYLSKQLEAAMSELAEYSKNDRQYRRLVRELGIVDEKYRRYMKSLAQGEVDSSLEENPNLSNISISQPASFCEKPVRPNKLVNLILGLALGTFGSLGLAVFLEYMSTTVRSREDLESSLALPVIATVPRVSRRESVIQVEA